MPVKDAISIAQRAIKAITDSGAQLTVWNDRSTAENTAALHRLQQEWHFNLIDVATLTGHPSPNYRLLLITEQQKAIEDNADLIIVESDVIIQTDTLHRMRECALSDGIGMVAAITTDEQGNINFPYLYAKHYPQKGIRCISTTKRLSFCCTLLTLSLLRAFPFTELDTNKDWYDVFISHKSISLGFKNLLLCNTPVLHLPHSSRPWKQLKYTNPLKYYWMKLTHGKDRI